MSRLVRRIDEEIERQSLLKHPFYQMWSHGELTVGELAGYSKEYFQLVKAVPGLVRNVHSHAASPSERAQIAENEEEESTHIEPWVRFAGAMGVPPAELRTYAGTRKTVDSTSRLESITGSSYLEGVAALYAYERQLPEISRSKIDGLTKRYGFMAGDATRYFELHEEADVRHAAVWRGILEHAGEDEVVMDAAVGSLSAQNLLLDSVIETYCR